MRRPWRRDGDLTRMSPPRAFLAHAYRRLLHRPLTPPDAPVITFAIPLVGKDRAEDWDNTCARLSDTLRSVRSQDHGRVEVIVCGQDRPDGFPASEGERFLPVPHFEAAAGRSDRRDKMRAIARDMARQGGFRYVVTLDADDIVHPGLCRFVAQDNNGRGYLIDKGYIIGPAGRVALLDPVAKPFAFWDFCGSCAILAVDLDRQALPAWYLGQFASRHHEFRAIAAAHGYPLDTVPFPAALYIFDHGTNASIRYGRAGGKWSYLRDHALPAAEARAVLAEFGHRLRPRPDQASMATGDSRLSTIA